MGNFNDQSIPKLDGMAVDPIDIPALCLRGEFLGLDGNELRPGNRVRHVAGGVGYVLNLVGLGSPLQRIEVVFDLGSRTLTLPCAEFRLV